MTKAWLIIGAAIFLFVAYWFLVHAYVIVRLTAVFGLMAFVAIIILAIVYARRLL